jgi:hypothetical protein
MKKIRNVALLGLVIFISSCGLFRKTTKSEATGPLEKHSNTLLWIWSKPVTVDSAKLFQEFGYYANGQQAMNDVNNDENVDSNDPANYGGGQGNTKKRFIVEVYLSNGQEVLAFVGPKIMVEIMLLPWEPNPANSRMLTGYAFTGDFLKNYSFQTIKDIDTSSLYDEDQKELLKRYHNREKYELLSRFPIGPQKGRLNINTSTGASSIIPIDPTAIPKGNVTNTGSRTETGTKTPTNKTRPWKKD